MKSNGELAGPKHTYTRENTLTHTHTQKPNVGYFYEQSPADTPQAVFPACFPVLCAYLLNRPKHSGRHSSIVSQNRIARQYSNIPTVPQTLLPLPLFYAISINTSKHNNNNNYNYSATISSGAASNDARNEMKISPTSTPTFPCSRAGESRPRRSV